MRIPRFKYKFFLSRTVFRVFDGAEVIVSSHKISRSKLVVNSGATLVIGSNVVIKDAEIYVEKGSLIINDYSIISGENRNNYAKIIVNNGNVVIGHHSKISCNRIWVRFGGNLSLGNYTNINWGSEIRCDERIEIGSYNQISYRVKVWDTNTHSILGKEERRKIAEKYYPYFGYEEAKPMTAPTSIGDDCWIGEGVSILKGTQIGCGSIIGFGTIVSGQLIPPNGRIVQEIKLRNLSEYDKGE